jgi:hypothetical protein
VDALKHSLQLPAREFGYSAHQGVAQQGNFGPVIEVYGVYQGEIPP